MASPTRRRDRVSPIRNLDQKSPYRSRKLRTIFEEDQLESKVTPKYSYSHSPTLAQIQNRIYLQKVKNLAEAENNAYNTFYQNSRLKRENQILKEQYMTTKSLQVEQLSKQLALVNNENKKLLNDIDILKSAHQKDLEQYIIENESLKKQVITLEQRMYQQTVEIQEKYTKYANQDIGVAKQAYIQDLSKVLETLEKIKNLLIEKQGQVVSLTKFSQQISVQHRAHLQYLISQNNSLRGKIDYTSIKLNNEVKQAQTLKELEKSRTHGLMAYCLENNAFMEKQVHKLAEQLLQKNISIQSFTKDILKLQKNLEITQKRYQHKLQRVQQEKIQKISEIENSMKKLQKFYKEEIAQLNAKQMELCEIIASRENQIQNLKRQLEHEKQIVSQTMNKNQQLKANINRMHEDHANQISKVMTQSNIRRRSMKNLSQISSMRELSGQVNSSNIKKSVLRRDSIDPAQEGSSGQLYTVHEEIAKSHYMPGGSQQQDQDIDVKELVLHYQNMIDELKSNKIFELQLANEKIQKLNQSLRQKQQEVLEILERFSPLMQFKLNGQSLEQERKDKIEKHLKADISLLGVILDKYKIAGLSSRD